DHLRAGPLARDPGHDGSAGLSSRAILPRPCPTGPGGARAEHLETGAAMQDVAGELMAGGRHVAVARVHGVDDNVARPHRHDYMGGGVLCGAGRQAEGAAAGSACAWIAVMTTVLMMSSTRAPRERSLTGL